MSFRTTRKKGLEKRHLRLKFDKWIKDKRQLKNLEEYPKIKILLVDDHQAFRKNLGRILTSQQEMQVIAEASNGEEAIKKAVKESPDVIIMDVNMPRMNGIEATQKIKAIIPKVQIIGLSFHEDQEVINSMRSAGATTYIAKSKVYEALCTSIRHVMRDEY